MTKEGMEYPPKANDEFVWRMEEILEIYKREYDSEHPLLFIDESIKQQIQEVIESVPMASK